MWSFVLENKEVKIPKKVTDAQLGTLFSKFLVPTFQLEMKVGLPLWDRIRGEKGDKFRRTKNKIWNLATASKKAAKRKKDREKQELENRKANAALLAK